MRRLLWITLLILTTGHVWASEQWKTYTDTKYGYQFDYPADLLVVKGDYDKGGEGYPIEYGGHKEAISLFRQNKPYGFDVVPSSEPLFVFFMNGRGGPNCFYDAKAGMWTKSPAEKNNMHTCCDSMSYLTKQHILTFTHDASRRVSYSNISNVILIDRTHRILIERDGDDDKEEKVQEKIFQSFHFLSDVHALDGGCQVAK
jgi:hypothetical protein